MARSLLPVVSLTPNTMTAYGSGTAADAAGQYIDTNGGTAINNDVQAEQLILMVTVATATTNVTIKAGAYPPALAANIGDSVNACVVGTTPIGPFESGRFLQANGQIWIDTATAANVTYRAFRVPRNV